MKAMILAAGRGERLRPLTDNIPKPLLPIAGKPLIVYHLERLHQIGITEVIINLAYKGEMIQQLLGSGDAYGVKIHYSQEPEGALDTGGGIVKVLSQFADQPFIVINADIWTDYPLQTLTAPTRSAHLVLVPKPEYANQGDFDLAEGLLTHSQTPRYNVSGIAIYQPSFFDELPTGRFSIVPFWRAAISKQQISGEVYQGHWFDIGTVERYQQCNETVTLTR